jgi:AcrR family transcriptional regulator
MDNPSRSERSRNAALQAAIMIISRDGPGRLTLDAIAREAGMSKGGVMHQFPTKEAVLTALLDQQTEYFEEFSRQYKEKAGAQTTQPELAAQIATMREVVTKPRSIAFAILGALAQQPSRLSKSRDIDKRKVEVMKAESVDKDLALLRWAAARGLALTAMFGMCPLSDKERERLYDRLLDDEQWPALEKPKKRPTSPSKRAKKA